MPPDHRRPFADRFHAATGFPPLFWLAVVGCSLLAMLLLTARMTVTRQVGHSSLVWDVFLAWVPVAPALAVHWMGRRTRPRRGLMLLLLVVWLIFFPNAPYLVTQMIHLNPLYGPSHQPLPEWLDTLLPSVPHYAAPEWFDFLLLSTVVVAGLLLSLASMRLIERALTARLGRRLSIAVAGWIVLLTSFGVAVGRYIRLNSWDVFSKPLETLDQIAIWITEPRIGISTVVFAALLALVYVAVVQAGRVPPRPHSPA